MVKLILDGALVDDSFVMVESFEQAASLSDVIVPLTVFTAHKAQWLARSGRLGVRLEAGDDAGAVADVLDCLTVVAIDFPAFTDGRGYSTARLLREKYHYRGQVRAVGDVFRDAMFYLARCGFNAFMVRASETPENALLGLHTFSESYQSSVDQPAPLYRRRLA
jgi:uncharacterized protein (DUF934 family)